MKVSKRSNLPSILKIVFYVGLAVLLLIPLSAASYAQTAEKESPLDFRDHCSQTGYYTLRDLDDDSVIMKTARMIHVNDEYITGDNTHYIVERVDEQEQNAWARSHGSVKLSEPPDFFTGILESKILRPAVQAGDSTVSIGVYHSHGAEAYIQGDGDEFIDEGGGILDVGESFAEALEGNGLEVKHNTETHVPHDAGAYNRSRRTAEELLRDDADVLFDIHRDAVPAEEYKAVVDDEKIVQIQFVVGRQNQNVEINRQFAESMKEAADRQHPGLIKGIFMANGSYNQDLTPLNLLLEVGSHENTKEGAEESVVMFADAVNYYFAGPQAEREQAATGGTALRTILWLVLVAVLSVAAYLIISTGSIEETRAKIKHFYQREFAEFRRKRGNRGNGN